MSMKNLMIKISTMLMMVAVLAIAMGTSSCKKDEETPVPPVVVLDGYYVKGSVTAYADFNSKSMMKVTRNEVTQENRASLLELYLPIKAGADGFTITKVAGSVQTVYGPALGFGVVTTPTNDEPKVPFQRGAVTPGATTKFTVPEDGFYHVVFDFDLNIAVVARVHWGLIGAATPSGWGNSTDLTESAFNINTMSWTISNMELRGGDWKFRYSNGWKIELDTNIDLGGGKKGVKVNTNFGGAVNALVPGGANIVNADPGVYTCLMTYTLGTGYVATMTKTAGLPLTNWTGVACDAVGTGVSADNPTAIPDPSSWGWGNQLIADNAGIPVVTGDLYTWTWTGIILEAAEGFKVRTLNGVAPPSGGANFDAGFTALNVAASSPNIVDAGGNLSATVKGSYTITLKIDAANNDNKEIIIIAN